MPCLPNLLQASFLILELFQDPLLNILLVMEAVPLFGMTVGSLKVLLV